MPSDSPGRSGICTTRSSFPLAAGPAFTSFPSESTTEASSLRSSWTGSLNVSVTTAGELTSLASAAGDVVIR